jgi:hypothetical protein
MSFARSTLRKRLDERARSEYINGGHCDRSNRPFWNYPAEKCLKHQRKDHDVRSYSAILEKYADYLLFECMLNRLPGFPHENELLSIYPGTLRVAFGHLKVT